MGTMQSMQEDQRRLTQLEARINAQEKSVNEAIKGVNELGTLMEHARAAIHVEIKFLKDKVGDCTA
jgi:uncharacterized coiled-coil protein SlyX